MELIFKYGKKKYIEESRVVREGIEVDKYTIFTYKLFVIMLSPSSIFHTILSIHKSGSPVTIISPQSSATPSHLHIFLSSFNQDQVLKLDSLISSPRPSSYRTHPPTSHVAQGRLKYMPDLQVYGGRVWEGEGDRESCSSRSGVKERK